MALNHAADLTSEQEQVLAAIQAHVMEGKGPIAFEDLLLEVLLPPDVVVKAIAVLASRGLIEVKNPKDEKELQLA